MPESFECEKCGDEFDTERGLNIHKGQKHSDEEEETGEKENDTEESVKEEEKKTEKEENITEDTETKEVQENNGILQPENITVSAYNAVLGAFFIGLVFGISLSLTAGLFSFDLDLSASKDPLLVELESGDYPFEGVEAGIGNSNPGIGNKTYYLKGEPYLGSSDAPIKMVSYEDFQCPYCGRFHQNSFPQIMDNYISTGKVQLYFKDFPLRIHPWADDAGIAAQCALNQDVKAYWAFNKGFFDNQKALKRTYNQNQTMFDRSMYRWAEQTGLDKEKFKTCYDNRETEGEVAEDLQQGSEKGVGSTPTFFIDNKKITGAQPYTIFKNRIEIQLKNP